jgi:hypothetical protein
MFVPPPVPPAAAPTPVPLPPAPPSLLMFELSGIVIVPLQKTRHPAVCMVAPPENVIDA